MRSTLQVNTNRVLIFQFCEDGSACKLGIGQGSFFSFNRRWLLIKALITEIVDVLPLSKSLSEDSPGTCKKMT